MKTITITIRDTFKGVENDGPFDCHDCAAKDEEIARLRAELSALQNPDPQSGSLLSQRDRYLSERNHYREKALGVEQARAEGYERGEISARHGCGCSLCLEWLHRTNGAKDRAK